MAHMMFLSWLLGSAAKLEVLSCSLGMLLWFLPLLHVKHLLLEFGEHVDTGNVFAASPNAYRLETLSLSAFLGVLDAPGLMLQSLPFLLSVQLNGIRPAATHLPEKCRLHLKGLVEEDFLCEAWSGAMGKVGSLYFEHDLTIADPLPAFFGKMQNVNTVILAVKQLGVPEKYLSLVGLSQVERLYLGGTHMYLKIPAKVSWESVMFSSTKKLGLSIDDPTWFAKTVPHLCMKFTSLTGPSSFKVIQAWAACGRSWTSDLDAWSSAKVWSELFCGLALAEDMDFDACCCGGCMPCLLESGVAHRIRDDTDSESDSDEE